MDRVTSDTNSRRPLLQEWQSSDAMGHQYFSEINISLVVLILKVFNTVIALVPIALLIWSAGHVLGLFAYHAFVGGGH